MVELCLWWLQHGAAECLLNTIEACAIDAWPDLVCFVLITNCSIHLCWQQIVYYNNWKEGIYIEHSFCCSTFSLSDWIEYMQNEHFPFIYCVESLVNDGKYSKWETCYEKLGKDPKPISDCYASGRGKEVNFFTDLLVFFAHCYLFYMYLFYIW